MLKWVLYCRHCKNEFVHSEVAAPPFYDPFYVAPKPDFPEGGKTLTCPHCKKESVYQRHQLVYSTTAGA